MAKEKTQSMLPDEPPANEVEAAPVQIPPNELPLARAETPEAGSDIMAMVERLAMIPDANPDVLGKLLDMQERVMDRNARDAFYRDFVEAQRNMPKVVRDAQNDHTKSTYARLETINKRLLPHVGEFGFSLSFGTDDCPLPDHVRVTLDLIHREGHVVHRFYDCPHDAVGSGGKVNKTPTHARASATTYGQRYLTCLAWDIIVTDDDDGNAAGGEVIETASTADVKKINEILELLPREVGKRMMAFFKVACVEDIYAENVPTVLDMLSRKVDQMNKAKEGK